MLIIESEKSELIDLTLIDIMGQVVFSDQFTGDTQINLEGDYDSMPLIEEPVYITWQLNPKSKLSFGNNLAKE